MKDIVRNFFTGILCGVVTFYLIVGQIFILKAQAADDPYTALGKATTTYNGVDYKNEYNPLYYYLNYEDLRNAYGTDAQKLVEHWVVFGKKEGRVANRLIGDSTEYVVPTGDTGMVVIPKTKHDNGGMTYGQEVQARSVAKQIADAIIKATTPEPDPNAANTNGNSTNSSTTTTTSSTTTTTTITTTTTGNNSNDNKVTEVEKVAYAAGIVKAYCDQGTFTLEGRMYRTAYGVFIGGEYSSAGATRALGLILDYLGITWVHKNINTYADQYCQVIVDGIEGYGDGITATAGYGKHPSEGGNEKDAVSYAKVRSKFEVATQRY